MHISLLNPRFQFSLYPNLLTVDAPTDQIDINMLIEIIQYGYLRPVIEQLRSSESKPDYQKIKREEIPAVTLSGIFGHRSAKGFIEHSGLMQVDIDHVEYYDTIFQKICRDPYTYVAFRSPGGRGVKVIVKVNPSIETHLGQFYAIQKYYDDELDLEIDPACKDVARCLLLSWDPELYCNPFSDVFEEVLSHPAKRKERASTENRRSVIEYAGDDARQIVEEITLALEKAEIDITADYSDWIRIGYALSTTLQEEGREYFHRISALYPDYDYEECDRQYEHLHQHNEGRVKLGTLIFYAREAGIVFDPSGKKRETEKERAMLSEKYPDKEDRELYEKLIKRRKKEANIRGVDVPRIFSDAVIDELVRTKPVELEEFIRISGIGLSGAQAYAHRFLPLIRHHLGIKGETRIRFDEVLKEKIDPTLALTPAEKELYESLRRLRMEIAREEKLPPYYVFNDKTLLDLVQKKPKDEEGLLRVFGIGKHKLAWFGERVLEVFGEWGG